REPGFLTGGRPTRCRRLSPVWSPFFSIDSQSFRDHGIVRPMRVAIYAAIFLSVQAWAGYAPNEELVSLPTRAGVNLPILLVRPARAPSAVVLLFPGGDGLLKLTPSGMGAGTTNFVIRTRQSYA